MLRSCPCSFQGYYVFLTHNTSRLIARRSAGGKSGQHRAAYFLTGRVRHWRIQTVPQKTNYPDSVGEKVKRRGKSPPPVE